MSATSFPPIRSSPSRAVSSDEALSSIQAYLAAIPSTPYLLPNARLDVHGPSAQASASSVVLHNLQRVEAGLRGEWLAPVLELEGEEGGRNDVPGAFGRQNKKTKFGDDDASAAPAAAAEGWQDLDEYQREQTIEEGGAQGFDAMAVDEEIAQQEEVLETEPTAAEAAAVEGASKPKTAAEKEARKKAKKERARQERKEKATSKTDA